MELEFLRVGKPCSKNDFLIHISKLILVSLNIDDTYNTLFDKLKKQGELESMEEQKAIQFWIDFNLEGQTDKSVFNTVLVEEQGLCAIFNLRN